MKTVNTIEPTKALIECCESLTKHRKILRNIISQADRDKTEDVCALLQEQRDELIATLSRDDWYVVNEPSGKLAVMAKTIGKVDDPDSDYESSTCYRIMRVIRIGKLTDDEIAGCFEEAYATRGGCGHSHDCCGCVRWSCEAKSIGYDTFALRLTGIRNI